MGSRRKRKSGPAVPAQAEPHQAVPMRPQQLGDTEGLTPVLALDCEMVGVGPQGARSSLARCAVVWLEAWMVCRQTHPSSCTCI